MNLTAAAHRLRTDSGAAALDAVIAAAAEATDADIAALAQVLGASGAKLAANPKAVDVASTGGPSSLSTLVVPLQLGGSGSIVPKLGVPGRPAGGIDVLATVPGYRFRMSAEEVDQRLPLSSVIHVLAQEFAPLDAALFARRQQVGAQAVVELAIASLLSKKLAMGVSRAGLDVRVSTYGNFGADWVTARRNAERFCSVAALTGIDAVCVLTDASLPYQPWIGRGEALIALANVVSGRPDPWLTSHVDECWQMVLAVTGSAERPSQAELAAVLARQLQAHGTSNQSFRERVEAVLAEPRVAVRADQDGYPVVDLRYLRKSLVAAQALASGSSFSDAAGVTLLEHPNDKVRAGTTIAEIRARVDVGDAFVDRISSSFRVDRSRVDRRSLEVVRV